MRIVIIVVAAVVSVALSTIAVGCGYTAVTHTAINIQIASGFFFVGAVVLAYTYAMISRHYYKEVMACFRPGVPHRNSR